MQPVYIKQADAKMRTTWMDNFIALEPVGGFHVVVAETQNGSRSQDLAAIFNRLPAPVRHRPSTIAPKHQQARSRRFTIQ